VLGVADKAAYVIEVELDTRSLGLSRFFKTLLKTRRLPRSGVSRERRGPGPSHADRSRSPTQHDATQAKKKVKAAKTLQAREKKSSHTFADIGQYMRVLPLSAPRATQPDASRLGDDPDGEAVAAANNMVVASPAQPIDAIIAVTSSCADDESSDDADAMLVAACMQQH
jgi:hypothetical protein